MKNNKELQLNSNFIKTIIQKDLEQGKYQQIITRFPPEPNGFLHLGHARAIIVNFELAKIFNGKTILRYDDTNPTNEKQIYVDAILQDLTWLGYKPDRITFASDYFLQMYEKALFLIRQGKAYVDDLTAEEITKSRGNLLEKGINSPYRNRSIYENIVLFEKMKAGVFKEGSKVLRAKIDMASPNLNLRDAVLYRVLSAFTLKKKHWYIYPTYDFAHPLEDAFEKITHSLCSLEFEDHRPLYDWVIRETKVSHIPRQIEFGRLNLTQTLMSKRYLKALVEEKKVNGWNDPRMPTLSGIRHKGYTPQAIKNFVLEIGLSKVNSQVKREMLESCVRDNLKAQAFPRMAVINPLKVTIVNYPENQIEQLEAPFFPKECHDTKIRHVAFSRHLYIEKDDFAITKPNPQYKRLVLGEEVRLLHAYFIKACDVIKNDQGEVIEILATYDPETKSGSGFKGRKPNGTIHFVESKTALAATFNYFFPLLTQNNDFNQESWQIKQGFVENNLAQNTNHTRIQFLRQGYFMLTQTQNQKLNFNEIVSLKANNLK
ncbi:glutamine--tRNA ligase [Candidatus Phytoplasma solani]|uniref:Glutamine--tRNA ligase n=1 Tax=Candidatus Phytoplasma solani TaxID=69896 RepID=A0A421NXK9_9MOLU|nr:glutamine--tRNA ligase [Candidatus Phytoplasma solani]RMI88767.1 glutaminyl-tRNA synthetase [Candidatus Phytoplasma solani]CCP88024.1 Glutamine tRNA ligase [Candidatus Phytoplasma solani]CCP88806.1 Glutamine tRNA ligase [Candidatus Phytoplasma solani]